MNDWSKDEQELFAKLPRELPPPAELQNRVATAVFRRRNAWRYAAAAAAVVALVSVGFVVGRKTAMPAGRDGSTYVLFLRRSGDTTAAQVAEYRAWAAEARKNGTLVGGAKLKSDGKIVLPTGQATSQSFAADGDIGGFFMIQAPDLDAATQIALATPHLRYGGTIELRPVDQ